MIKYINGGKMTLQEKKDLYDKYIGKPVSFYAKFGDGTIRFVDDILKSNRILENSDMVISYMESIDYAVNADILNVSDDAGKRTLIIEYPVDKV